MKVGVSLQVGVMAAEAAYIRVKYTEFRRHFELHRNTGQGDCALLAILQNVSCSLSCGAPPVTHCWSLAEICRVVPSRFIDIWFSTLQLNTYRDALPLRCRRILGDVLSQSRSVSTAQRVQLLRRIIASAVKRVANGSLEMLRQEEMDERLGPAVDGRRPRAARVASDIQQVPCDAPRTAVHVICQKSARPAGRSNRQLRHALQNLVQGAYYIQFFDLTALHLHLRLPVLMWNKQPAEGQWEANCLLAHDSTVSLCVSAQAV